MYCFVLSDYFGKKRYSLDSDGNIHQFTYTGTGDNTWHWAGRTGKDQNPDN